MNIFKQEEGGGQDTGNPADDLRTGCFGMVIKTLGISGLALALLFIFLKS